MATISRLAVSLTARTRGFRRGMASAGSSLRGFIGSIVNVKTAIIGLVGAAGIGFLAKNIIDVNARFQTLKSSLKTVTGGAKPAAKAFKLINKFAKETPFDLEQVVGAFIKLKALGLDPSEEALRSYGNTASAMGKSLNDFIEAVADASTNEFERLKEFGIKAKKQGDQIEFTFQGVKTKVGANAEEIQEFLKGIGENTFGSAMKDQMDNLTPAFSNLGAAFDGLKTKIGEAGINDLVVQMARGVTGFIEGISVETVEKVVDAVVLFGFEMVRSLFNGIKWLANFGENVKSFKLLWLESAMAVVNFGGVLINIAASGIQAIDSLIEKTMQFVNTLAIDVTQALISFRNSIKVFGFIPLFDPDVTAEMEQDLEKLRVQALKIKLGLTEETSQTEFAKQGLSSAATFLGGIKRSLAHSIVEATQEAPPLNLKVRTQDFIKGAEEILNKQEEIFKGEDKLPQLPVGTDPNTDSMADSLRSIDSKLSGFPAAPGAFAG